MRQRISVRRDAGVIVKIDREKVLINDKLFYFRSNDRWLEEVKVEQKSGMEMMEIRYRWKTSRGKTNDSLLLPVPQCKLDEAED